MKKLENLKWSPKWVTHLGCVKGCLDYLNINVSDAWLFGATGHAFIINTHEELCPSGPTAWNTEMLFTLGENIGYKIEGVFSNKLAKDFAEKKKLAWNTVKAAIDEGLPCYGWELDIPEFYIVYGYSEEGYYYRDFDNSGKGPKPWKELADTGIGVLEMYIVNPSHVADDSKAINEAFQQVLEHSRGPAKWIFPKYKAGLAGFNNWIHALDTGKADGFGNAYNAVVWNECRQYTVLFLKEVKERLANKLGAVVDEAIEHYEVVATNLESFTRLFPFTGPNTKGDEVKDPDRIRKGLEHLRAAKEAEALGLKTLEKMVSKM